MRERRRGEIFIHHISKGSVKGFGRKRKKKEEKHNTHASQRRQLENLFSVSLPLSQLLSSWRPWLHQPLFRFLLYSSYYFFPLVEQQFRPTGKKERKKCARRDVSRPCVAAFSTKKSCWVKRGRRLVSLPRLDSGAQSPSVVAIYKHSTRLARVLRKQKLMGEEKEEEGEVY